MATAKKKSSKSVKWYQNLSKPVAGALIFAVVFGIGGAYYLSTSHALTPLVTIPAGQMTPFTTPPVKLPYLTQEQLADKHGMIVYQLPAPYTPNKWAASGVEYKFHIGPTVKATYRICASFRRDQSAPAEGAEILMTTSYPEGGLSGDLSSVANLSVAGTTSYIYSCAPQKVFVPRFVGGKNSGYDITASIGNINGKHDMRVANIVLEQQL